MLITNWGRYPKINANIFDFNDEFQAQTIVDNNSQIITRGLGRCYGDSSLSKNIISTLKYNHFINFDSKNGIVTCESGVSLAEILSAFIKKGWFLPVTPGTKFVTVGGAIASDMHGKNHHKEKSFESHVLNNFLLNPMSIKAFNALYFLKESKSLSKSIVDYDTFLSSR